MAASRKEPVPLKFAPEGALADAWQQTVAMALTLPGVEESRSYGTPALKVKGKLIGRLRSEAEGGLALFCDMMEREMLIQADPNVFYVTDHYVDYPMVLVNLLTVRKDALPALLEAAWRMQAPAKLINARDAD